MKGIVALYLEMDYILECSRYKIGYVELIISVEKVIKILHLVDRSYDLTQEGIMSQR